MRDSQNPLRRDNSSKWSFETRGSGLRPKTRCAKRNKRRDARAARGKLAEKLFFSQRFEISLWRLAKALQKCFSIYTVDVLHSFLGCVPLTAVNAHVTPREWSSDTKIASKEVDAPPNIYHIIWESAHHFGHTCIAVGFFRDWYCSFNLLVHGVEQESWLGCVEAVPTEKRGMDAFVSFCCSPFKYLIGQEFEKGSDARFLVKWSTFSRYKVWKYMKV